MRRFVKIVSHPVFVVVGVLLFDQILKIWVKLNMMLNQEFSVFGDWFIIHFTENNGMAFGIEFGNELGKLALTLFRLAAITGLIIYLIKFFRRGYPRGVIVCMSLILAGAIGNVIDSAIYGVIFSHSEGTLAELFPASGGYAPVLYGSVVDMLYFPVIEGFLPTWVPFWGGDYFIFFRPVFNIADSAITIGILTLVIFFREHFRESSEQQEETTPTAT